MKNFSVWNLIKIIEYKQCSRHLCLALNRTEQHSLRVALKIINSYLTFMKKTF